jgi:hypothetical protein
VIDDPTLQRDYDVTCPMCGHQGAVFVRSHDGVKHSTLGLIVKWMKKEIDFLLIDGWVNFVYIFFSSISPSKKDTHQQFQMFECLIVNLNKNFFVSTMLYDDNLLFL